LYDEVDDLIQEPSDLRPRAGVGDGRADRIRPHPVHSAQGVLVTTGTSSRPVHPGPTFMLGSLSKPDCR
jgi:hypothetical protein